MQDKLYWVWLQQVLGYGSRQVKSVLKKHKSPQDFYAYCKDIKRNSKNAGGKFFKRFNKISPESCLAIIERAEKSKQKIITYFDSEYPQKLRNIINPPCVLYTVGEIPKVDEQLSITVVGTRSATAYGMNMAFDFAYNLSKSEAIIISGGAVGIDITAHKAMLKAQGQGICVLGCGIDCKYLEENRAVREAITKNGALISEFPPGYRAYGRNFPIRNRIMAALCDALLVVEAGQRSGTMITAGLALEQGKEIFAIPGNINSPKSVGTNQMIQDGAKVALCVEDILEDFHVEIKLRDSTLKALSKSSKKNEVSIKQKNIFEDNKNNKEIFDNNNESTQDEIPAVSELSSQMQDIYLLLQGEPVSLDAIIEKTGKKVRDVLSILTQLEILGLVKSYPGKKYGLS